MKIFPAVHYSMGGLWADYSKSASGGLEPEIPNSRPTFQDYALGECDYQYHGANRLGANSLLSCIFSGLFVGPCIETYIRQQSIGSSQLAESIFSSARARHEDRHRKLLASKGGQNPYLIHQELGDILTRAATVVRRNDQLKEGDCQRTRAPPKAAACSLADTGSWTNQNVIFTKALTRYVPHRTGHLERGLASRQRVPRCSLQAGICDA